MKQQYFKSSVHGLQKLISITFRKEGIVVTYKYASDSVWGKLNTRSVLYQSLEQVLSLIVEQEEV